MAAEELELIRRTIAEAVERGDTAPAVDALDSDAMAIIYASFDPEVEFHEDASFPEAGTYRGIEAVRGYFDGFSESFDELRMRPEDFVDLGEGRVLALFELTTRGRGSGVPIESHPGWIFEIRDGRAVRIDAWLDRETALGAAGLAENG